MELQHLLQEGLELVEASPIKPIPDEVNKTKINLQQLMDKGGKALHIAIMGAVKAGKSTLLNALVQNEVSPVGVTETTATIMRVLYGPEQKAEVIMNNQSPIIGTIEEVLKVLDTHKNDDDFMEHCCEVCIYLPNKELQNVEIVDTPGLNTVTKRNQQRSLDYIQQADIILWVLNGEYIGQSDVEDEIEDFSNMGKKMLCVISQVDDFSAEEKEEVLQEVIQDDGDLFEKIFLLSGKQAVNSSLIHDEKGINSSGLGALKDYIKTNYMQQASDVHVESILDSLQATIKNDISYHEEYLDTQKEKYQNYQQMVKDLEYQSSSIQQDFRINFRNWVERDLLHDAVKRLNQKIDDASFEIKNNLTKQIEPLWKDVFSQERIANELKIYMDKRSNELLSMWDDVLSRLKQRYDFRLSMDTNALIHSVALTDLNIDNDSTSSSIAKGTALGAIGGFGASAYAAGLGTYAAHLSLAGALGSFMVPALVIGAAAGLAKGYFNFQGTKKELKAKASYDLNEVRYQIQKSIQDDYDKSVAIACQQICDSAKLVILKENFNINSLPELLTYNQDISVHIKKLRGYLNAAPSYESVTDELRQEIQTIRQSMEAKAQEYLAKMETDTSSGWSDEEVNQKIQQMSAELEKEKQKQIAAITKNNEEKQQLLAATNHDLEIQMQTAEQKLRQMAQRMQEKDEKLHENSIKLQEKDKLLKQQSKELKSLEKMLKEMDVRIQEMKDSNEVVSNQSIHAELMNMMKKAKHEVDIMSPWVSRSIVNQEFKHVVQEMIDRGVTLKIVYGIENRYNKNNRYQKEDRDRLDESERMLNSLKNLRNAQTHIFSKYFSSHVKLVLCDDDSYILTSCNVLSNKGTNWEEVGEISNNKTLLQEYRKKFFDFP